MSEQKEGIFQHASPKLTFLFGFVLGLALVSLVGFIVLLVRDSGWGTSRNANAGDTVASADAVGTQPLPPLPPEDQVGTFRAIDAKTDHIRGEKNAAVTILEYSDLECPFCKRFHPTVQQTLDAYQGKVRWVYRHFPLRSLHSKAAKEAEASECAAELGGNDAFWKYIDRVFEITPANDGLDPAELPKIAAAIGLNKSKFETCLNSGKYAQKVQQDENDAVSAGGRGTPHSIIIAGDQKIPVSGAVPDFELKRILDQVLQ